MPTACAAGRVRSCGPPPRASSRCTVERWRPSRTAMRASAEPRLGHRLDPSALVEAQTPCHTENLHRSVADSYRPAIMADLTQPPVEFAPAWAIASIRARSSRHNRRAILKTSTGRLRCMLTGHHGRSDATTGGACPAASPEGSKAQTGEPGTLSSCFVGGLRSGSQAFIGRRIPSRAVVLGSAAAGSPLRRRGL